ncbi:hypothetical protein KKH18_12910, partial [bacterium]|nr:hypothetical protein [bacterium]
DDTACYVHLSPGFQRGLTCDPFTVSLYATFTDARNFDLQISYDHSEFALVSVTPGTHPDLHILPHDTSENIITIDGFFHPNFTGITLLCGLEFMKREMIGDAVTEVGFIAGQGFSGTADLPEAIIFSGDTAIIDLEGTPPLAPMELVIIPQYSYARSIADSVFLRWNSVRFDVDGDTIINPEYHVVFEDRYENYGLIDTVGITMDTFFYDDFIKYYFWPYDSMVVNAGVYRIHAKRTQP